MKNLLKSAAVSAVALMALAAPATAHVWSIGWKSENGGLVFYGISYHGGGLGVYEDFSANPAGLVINGNTLSFDLGSAVNLNDCGGPGGIVTGACDSTWDNLGLDGAVAGTGYTSSTYGKYATATITSADLSSFGLVGGSSNSVTLTTYANNFHWDGVGFSSASVPLDIVVNQVPVPAALPLAAAGFGLMGLMGWRRRKSV